VLRAVKEYVEKESTRLSAAVLVGIVVAAICKEIFGCYAKMLNEKLYN